jgi:serine/threonine-protein kinase
VGTVYEARRLKLDLPVAIKLLGERASIDDELRQRFDREARAMAALAHPNIVAVSDFGVWQDRPYLVLELLQGMNLRQRLRDGPLEVVDALDIMVQMLRGVAHAHGQGLLHRDLKPDNIFLQELSGQRPHVKILDFGFAKFVGEHPVARRGPVLTREGITFGTPAYMSPEQSLGDEMDARTDIYSCGVILFEVLTGKKPFEGTFVEQRKKKLSGQVPDLLALRPELAEYPELVAIAQRALAHEPTGRFADGAEMLEALEALGPSGTTAPPPDTGRSAPAPARSRIGLGVAAALGIAVALGLLAKGGDDAQPAATAEEEEEEGPDGEAPPEMVIGLDEALPPPRAAADRPPANNPWKRPALPAAVERVRKRAARGDDVADAGVREVRRYARSHPEDPRPRLILAMVFYGRGWKSDAITRYEHAYRVDPASRGDARMRGDLLKMARSSVVGERAAEALNTIYGVEALPWVRRSLEHEPLTSRERQQLSALLARLR